MQQQLLRSRRISTGMSVPHIMVPWSVKHKSVKFSDPHTEGAISISFVYTGTTLCTAQIFCGMEKGAVKRLLNRLNQQHDHRENGATRSSFMGRGRKRFGWFGTRYTAVETGGVSAEMPPFLGDASCYLSGEGWGIGGGEEAGGWSPLFSEKECCGTSEIFEMAV